MNSILSQRIAEARQTLLHQVRNKKSVEFSLRKPDQSIIIDEPSVHSPQQSTEVNLVNIVKHEEKKPTSSKVIETKSTEINLKKTLFKADDPFSCKTCIKESNMKIYGNMEVCSWSCYIVEFDKIKIEFSKKKKETGNVR